MEPVRHRNGLPLPAVGDGDRPWPGVCPCDRDDCRTLTERFQYWLDHDDREGLPRAERELADSIAGPDLRPSWYTGPTGLGRTGCAGPGDLRGGLRPDRLARRSYSRRRLTSSLPSLALPSPACGAGSGISSSLPL